MTKPMDRRVRRTRRRLRDALIQLIMEKGYDNVTIQNITDAADLSRATFYLHYTDKDELLASSLEEMFDELLDSVKDIMLRRKLELTEGDAPRPRCWMVRPVRGRQGRGWDGHQKLRPTPTPTARLPDSGPRRPRVALNRKVVPPTVLNPVRGSTAS